MAGNVYLAGALALGALVIWVGFRASQDRSIVRARQVLLASVVYLPLLYGLLVFDGTRI
jgi:protoheme IX farnesyltransferase